VMALSEEALEALVQRLPSKCHDGLVLEMEGRPGLSEACRRQLLGIFGIEPVPTEKAWGWLQSWGFGSSANDMTPVVHGALFVAVVVVVVLALRRRRTGSRDKKRRSRMRKAVLNKAA